MSRCYLDTNFVYVHLRSHPGAAGERLELWRTKVIEAVAAGSGVISALVLDELAYRLILAWLRDEGEADPLGAYRADGPAVMKRMRRRLGQAWGAVDLLTLELRPTDLAVVDRAKALMAESGLTPRDAFHAAHALEAGCSLMATSDPAFGRVNSLQLIAPP